MYGDGRDVVSSSLEMKSSVIMNNVMVSNRFDEQKKKCHDDWCSMIIISTASFDFDKIWLRKTSEHIRIKLCVIEILQKNNYNVK